MKLSFYDVLFVIILQNLEKGDLDNNKRKELMNLAIEILPLARSISQKLEDYYTEILTNSIKAIEMLDEKDDTLVKLHNKYPSSYLMESSWFDESGYNFHKNSLCYPNTILLKTYAFEEVVGEQEFKDE